MAQVIAMEPNPDFIVRIEGTEKGDKWYDIGVAYKNATGPITVSLDTLPLKNKILLVPTKEE